jgi:carboxyl-terminal processing protease
MDNTPGSFNAVIQRLVEADMRALVLDLRFNPGGSLPAAVAVADRFLDGGTIVSVRGRWRAEESYKASRENTLPDFPMVVLVNDQSASGAEILAGALRDHERATVIGRRTYGKGSVQEVVELGSGNSAIKLTTAYYYLPNGELIHRTPSARQTGKWGVEPNLTVELTNEETQQILESRMAADRVNGPSTRPQATAKPVLDRQLVKGLEVLREKMDKPEESQQVAASQPAATKARTAG